MSAFEHLTDTISLAFAGDIQSIFLLVSVYVLMVCSYSVLYQVKVSRWPTVEGKLLTSGLRKYGGTEWAPADQEYVAETLYEYEVDGKKYLGKRLSPWIVVASHNARFVVNAQLNRVKRDPDGRVAVYYNPKAPGKSFLIPTAVASQLVTLFIGFIPGILYFYKYHI